MRPWRSIIREAANPIASVTLMLAASALVSCAGTRNASTTTPAGNSSPADSRESSGAAEGAPRSTAPAGVRCGDPVAGLDGITEAIVFAGEIHGTNEFPATFSRIVCQVQAGDPGGKVLVLLEVPVRMQPAIDAFMAASGEAARAALTQDAFWRREYQDGRSSLAMIRLIESLRDLEKAGAPLIVRGIDVEDAKSGDERDAGMARNLAAAIEQVHPARTLVYVGDVHARNVSGYPWAPADPYRSVATRVRESLGGVSSIGLKTNGGSAWTCTTAVASECGAKSLPERRQPPGPEGRLEPVPPEKASSGFQWTLNVGSVTASTPAIGGAKPGVPPPASPGT